MVRGWESGAVRKTAAGGRKGLEDDGAGRRPERDVRMSLHDEGMAADSVLARCAVQWRFAGRSYKQFVNIHDSSHWLARARAADHPGQPTAKPPGQLRAADQGLPRQPAAGRDRLRRGRQAVHANLRLAVIHHSPVSCCLLPAASPTPTPPGLYTRPFLVKLCACARTGDRGESRSLLAITGTIDCAKPNSHRPLPFPYYYYVQQIGSFPRAAKRPCLAGAHHLPLDDTVSYHLPAPTVPIPHTSFVRSSNGSNCRTTVPSRGPTQPIKP